MKLLQSLPMRSIPDSNRGGSCIGGSVSLPFGGVQASGPKAHRIAVLRQAVAHLECASLPDTAAAGLSLGLPLVDRHFPGARLACGALHEVVAATHGDGPAVFGFVVALMTRALAARPGPVILIAPRRCFEDFGKPYGHGLRRLGLDVGRLVLIETRSDKDALWAMGEALHSKAAAAVVGALGRDLDLTMSRRLSLAAAASGAPLLLLRPSPATGATAAATRWRVAVAPAARGRYGALARCRWSVTLERCRNGCTGQWLFEWDHVAHRFRLAEVLADRVPAEGAGQGRFRIAG
jgi:protein ImuA